MSAAAPVVVITGGAGFLGGALLRDLDRRRRDGLWSPASVRLFDRRPADTGGRASVTAITGDLLDPQSLGHVIAGADAVIHCASLVDWGQNPPGVVQSINVGGTHNVIAACRAAGVRVLVYTSTMDVIYQRQPVVNGDESMPLPTRPLDPYSASKGTAERAVTAAAGPALATSNLRPCGMWGPDDPYHLGSALQMAREGKLLFRMGDGSARFQFLYVGNAAHAHWLTVERLLTAPAGVSGQTYLITDFAAQNFFDFIAPIITHAGYPMPPRGRSLPYPLMYGIGTAVELTARILRPFVRIAPIITRTSAAIVCRDFTFNGDKLRRDMGYAPAYSFDAAMTETLASIPVRSHFPSLRHRVSDE